MRRILYILFVCLSTNAFATHIVGGALSLKWVGGNQYELTLKVLRDCFNGRPDFDDPANVSVFDKATNELKANYSMSFLSKQRLSFFGPNCSELPSTCTELGLYKMTITLSPTVFNNSAGYYFAYERCCRNHIIRNIVNPENAGITIYMEIPPPVFIKNSTPYFANNPNTFLCVDNLFTYNLDYKDDDGDSLVYSMVTPINGNSTPDNPGPSLPGSGPYPRVDWAFGFSDNVSIAGNPPMTIHPNTGEMTVKPTTPGVHVAAIRVEEFRFGKKLGEVRLELQFFVTTCSPNPIPEIKLLNDNGTISPFNLEVQIPNKLCFDILTTDLVDSLQFDISNPLLDSNSAFMPKVEQTKIKGLKETRTRFCWQTDCSITGIAPQNFQINVSDNGCPIPKSNKATINITVKPMPLVYSTDLLCMFLRDNLYTRFYFGDTASSNPYFSHYNIYRSFQANAFVKYDSLFPPLSDSYLDAHTPDYRNNNYRYMMRAVNKCGFEGVPSDTLGTMEQLVAEPRQQKLITVTVNQNKNIKIVWPQTPEKDFAQYYLYKSKRGDTAYNMISAFNRISDTVFFDDDVDVQQSSYCYYLLMRDTCDNVSENGKPACSILLRGSAKPFEQTVSWTPYTYWDNGTKEYRIQRQDHENPFQQIKVMEPQNHIWLDEKLNTRSGIYQYLVTATEDNMETASIPYYRATSTSNEITLIQSPLLHVPNAFTMNNDGINDEWGIRDVFVKDYHLRIYNRWGQMIFETRDKGVQWKGENTDSNNSESDVYVYLVTYTGWDGSAATKRGNVTLLR